MIEHCIYDNLKTYNKLFNFKKQSYIRKLI